MPVHEIRYRAYEGALTPRFVRLLAIPKFSLQAVFNKWIASSMFGLGVMALLGLTAYLLATNNELLQSYMPFIKQMDIFTPQQIFQAFFRVQYGICLIPLLLAAPKLISPELQHKALPILFSRPITRSGYITGKLAAVGLLLSFLTWAQGALLFLVMIVAYPADHAFIQNFFTESVPLLGKVVLYGVLLTVTLSMIGLAASAATKNVRFAGALLLIVLFGSEAASAIFALVLDNERIWIGVTRIFMALSEHLFSPAGEHSLSATQVGFSIAMWLTLTSAFVYWRLKPVEVFKE